MSNPVADVSRHMIDGENEKTDLEKAARAGLLSELAAKLHNPHTFKQGDFVQGREGLINKRNMEGPLLVMGVLDKPVTDNDRDSGSPYFREPLDIICGFLEDDGVLCELHLDSRRLEPYTGPLPESL